MIEAWELTKRYGPTVALDALSFDEYIRGKDTSNLDADSSFPYFMVKP